MRKIFLLITLSFLFVSCQERINFSVDDGYPTPVITGYVCTVPGQYSIRISSSSNFFSDKSKLPKLSTAKVDINGISLVADDSISGKYNTPAEFCAVAGETYTLTVKIDFNGDGLEETYTATETAPDIVDLSMLNMVPLSNNTETPHFLPFTTLIVFQDPIGPNNYGVHLYVTSATDSSAVYKRYHMSNSLSRYTTNFFGNEVEDGKTVFYPAYIITKQMMYVEKDTITIYPFDTIEVELNNHSKTYYDFIKQCKTSISGENPLFMSPAGKFSTNIEGGAIGAFGIYSCSSQKCVVPYSENVWDDEQLELRFGYKWKEILNIEQE